MLGYSPMEKCLNCVAPPQANTCVPVPSSLGWRIHGGVCHVCVPEAPRRWEGSWGGAYMAVFCHVCVRWVLVEARTHRKRRAMYAPPRGVGGDQPTWERSRDVPWNQWLHQLRSHRGLGRAKGAKGLGGAYMGGVSHVCVRWVLVEARTHRKKRDVCATPSQWRRVSEGIGVGGANRLGNEAGMCLGINGFTNYAPIAHWGGRREWVGGAYMAVFCHVCVRWVLVEARTHRKKPDVCATRRYVSAARSHRALVHEEDTPQPRVG